MSELADNIARALSVARILVKDEMEAVRLVEAAFIQRSAVDRTAGETGAGAASEYAQIVAAIAATAGTTRSEESDDGGAAATDLAVATLRRLAAPAVQTLDARARLSLYLSEVDRLDLHDQSVVFGLPVEETLRVAERARGEMWSKIIQSATEPERQLLLQHLPDAWLRDTLLQTLGPRAEPPEQLVRAVAEHAAARESRQRAVRPAQERAAPSGRPRQSVGRRIALGATTIVLVGLLGYVSARLLDSPRPDDFLGMTLSLVAESVPQVEGVTPDAADEYVRRRVGRPVLIPTVRESAISGTGVVRLETGDRVPVLYYGSEPNGPLAITLYTYDMIDRLESVMTLPDEMLTALRDEGRIYVTRVSGKSIAAWRNRADVYVATGSERQIQSLHENLSNLDGNRRDLDSAVD